MLIKQLFWPKLSLFFDGDSGGAGGGSGDPANPGQQQSGNGAGGDKKTFSQAELDAMFTDRAKQAQQSTLASVLKELGVENLDTVKATLKATEDAKAAQLTELQKAQGDVEKEKQARTNAEARAATVIELANNRLMQSAVMAEATKAEYKFNPEALSDVWAFIDRSKIKVEEDGNVSGVADAVKAVAKAKPYMVAGEQPKPRLGTPTTRQQTSPGQQQQSGGQQQQIPAQTVRL